MFHEAGSNCPSFYRESDEKKLSHHISVGLGPCGRSEPGAFLSALPKKAIPGKKQHMLIEAIHLMPYRSFNLNMWFLWASSAFDLRIRGVPFQSRSSENVKFHYQNDSKSSNDVCYDFWWFDRRWVKRTKNISPWRLDWRDTQKITSMSRKLKPYPAWHVAYIYRYHVCIFDCRSCKETEQALWFLNQKNVQSHEGKRQHAITS